MLLLLPATKGIARVDHLNAICAKAVFFNGQYNDPLFKSSSDTLYKYSTMAYKEAKVIDYKNGMAISLLHINGSYAARGAKDSIARKAYKDSILYKNTIAAMALAEQTGNDSLLGEIYGELTRYGSKAEKIENFRKSATHFKKINNKKKELEAYTNIVWVYGITEDVEAIEYADKCYRLAKEVKPSNEWEHELVTFSYINLAALYKTAGDYETALDYHKQGNAYGKAHSSMNEVLGISDLFYEMGAYDSAAYYWDAWNKDYPTYYFSYAARGNTLRGKIYLKQEKYDQALKMFNASLDAYKKNGKVDTALSWGVVGPYLYMGEVYAKKKDFSAAWTYAIEGMYFAKRANDFKSQVMGYELLSRLYHKLGKNDSAYLSLRNHVALKDSLQNKQFTWRLNNLKRAAESTKKEASIGLLMKDNQIKEEQLKQKATFVKFLIAVLIALVFAASYVFRTLSLRRRNDQLKQEQEVQALTIRQFEAERVQHGLRAHAAELEMQALRAQMNPHFIFNCLSSINRFILKNESKTASNYLTRFSRLIRMVLINSEKPLITLEDELQMLRLYLEMERLRFKDNFDFSITFLNEIDDDNVFIPPLLIQPFCENAIWHGLMQKDGHGMLEINFRLENAILYCTIKDNGVGREKAEAYKSKSAEKGKSMGLHITSERLALLNNEKGSNTSYVMEDLYDEGGRASGTCVHLKINYRESISETIL